MRELGASGILIFLGAGALIGAAVADMYQLKADNLISVGAMLFVVGIIGKVLSHVE